MSTRLEGSPERNWRNWSGLLGDIGAAGGHVNCLPTGEVVITLPPQEAPRFPPAVQRVFNGIAVCGMASTLPESSRRQVQEVALRLAHEAIGELIDLVLWGGDYFTEAFQSRIPEISTPAAKTVRIQEIVP